LEKSLDAEEIEERTGLYKTEFFKCGCFSN
jgi:hypothetical protein